MIEDNQLEAAEKMRQLLANVKQQKIEDAEVQQTIRTAVADNQFQNWVPKCEGNEFLVQVTDGSQIYLCAVEEPTWKDAASIELYAFRKTQDGRDYFSGEFERRELLRKSIRWIADPSSQEIHRNIEFDKLSHEIAEDLWTQLSIEFFIQLEEAQALYSSAKAFFSGSMGRAIHPVILDVYGIIKKMFVFNATEWNAVSMSNYERYQIVWLAYHEHNVNPTQESPSNAPPMDERAMRAMLGRMPKQ